MVSGVRRIRAEEEEGGGSFRVGYWYLQWYIHKPTIYGEQVSAHLTSLTLWSR